MTPFIIWLSKPEVEDMLSTLEKINNKSAVENNVLDSAQLFNFAEQLLIQNNSLMNIIQKIEPLSPIHKSSVDIFNSNKKCDHYKEQLINMQKHCSNFNTKLKHKFEEISHQICVDCPMKCETNS